MILVKDLNLAPLDRHDMSEHLYSIIIIYLLLNIYNKAWCVAEHWIFLYLFFFVMDYIKICFLWHPRCLYVNVLQ